jgi:hypothetical protein
MSETKIISIEMGNNTLTEDDFNVEVEDKRLYRMYCLVLRQLSPMQKGIQAAHSIVEYANKFPHDEEYKEWSKFDKTIIVLDAGTSFDIEEIIGQLDEHKVDYAVFKEEDLNSITTSIAFLVDDRVFDKDKFQSFDIWRSNKYPVIPMHCVAYIGTSDHDPNDYTYSEHHKEWVEEVLGGEKNEFLRQLISSKRLAN